MVSRNSGGGSSPGRSSCGSSSGGRRAAQGRHAQRGDRTRRSVWSSSAARGRGRPGASRTTTASRRRPRRRARAPPRRARPRTRARSPAEGKVTKLSWKKEPAIDIDKSAMYTMKLATTCGDMTSRWRRRRRRTPSTPSASSRARASSTTPSATGSPRASTCCSAATRRAPARAARVHDPGREPQGQGLKGERVPGGHRGDGQPVRRADSRANSGGSQFFLVFQDSPLPADYTPFGTLSEAGMKVLKKIADGRREHRPGRRRAERDRGDQQGDRRRNPDRSPTAKFRSRGCGQPPRRSPMLAVTKLWTMPGGSGPSQASCGGGAVSSDPWGRVDETGTVYVRTADGEQVVGSWQAGSPDEALAYFERKYEGLVVEIGLLEKRVKTTDLSAKDAQTAIDHIREQVDAHHAVGDLDALRPGWTSSSRRSSAPRGAQGPAGEAVRRGPACQGGAGRRGRGAGAERPVAGGR